MFAASEWTADTFNPEFYALKRGLRSLLSLDQLRARDLAAVKAIAAANGWFIKEQRRGPAEYAALLARTPADLYRCREITSREAARAFGYPGCCFDSFCELFGENYEKTSGKAALLAKLASPAKKHYLLNDFFYSWFWGYSLSFHHPCGYGCRRSLKANKAVLLAISEENPGYAREIVRHLKMPMLAWFKKPDTVTPDYRWFRNRTVLIFDGALSGRSIRYRDVVLLNTAFRGDKDRTGPDIRVFQQGNRCELGDKELAIWRDSQLLRSIPRDKEHEGLPLIFS